MYTPPQIYTNDDLKTRSFIYFYYNNKRYKFYNGNPLNVTLHPNHAKALKEKNTLLDQLKFEFHKALSNGWIPQNITKKQEIKMCFLEILEDKLKSPLSSTYKRDLEILCKQFINYIPSELLTQDVSKIEQQTIEGFLNQFKSSGRYYMNKRRTLTVYFSELVRKGYLDKNPVMRTSRQKVKARLHEIYTEKQLKNTLDYLRHHNYNLYLCTLITYGCLLRPHQEIRQLKIKHFRNNFSEIQLSGDENKSGRIRIVNVPKFVQDELKEHLSGIEDVETNIFTLSREITYNEDYFKTQWSRAKIQMLKKSIVQNNHTLYSFRHTAVVNVYRKTKDLHVLQQLLQHSNMIVTLNYLRGLGEVNNEDLKSVMPEL